MVICTITNVKMRWILLLYIEYYIKRKRTMETSKDFLANKVTPVMEPMMIELLLHKPDDPVDFMIKYLSKSTGHTEGNKEYHIL